MVCGDFLLQIKYREYGMDLENVVLQHFLVMMGYEYAQITQFNSIHHEVFIYFIFMIKMSNKYY